MSWLISATGIAGWRDAQTQSQFEDVEVKPQALDWLFCVAAGYPFNVSCDNLEGDFEPDRVVFQRRVHAQVMDYLANGIPDARHASLKHYKIIITRRNLRRNSSRGRKRSTKASATFYNEERR